MLKVPVRKVSSQKVSLRYALQEKRVSQSAPVTNGYSVWWFNAILFCFYRDFFKTARAGHQLIYERCVTIEGLSEDLECVHSLPDK